MHKSGLCTSSKNLKLLDISYNSFDDFSIKNLVNDCKKLDELLFVNVAKFNSLIDNAKEINNYLMAQSFGTNGFDYDQMNLANFNDDVNWLELIKYRFNENECAPFKRIEFVIKCADDIIEIKNLFKRKWQKDSLKVFYNTKNVVEFQIDERMNFMSS